MSNSNGWIGVDLDGTLAKYDKWNGIEHIGEPVPLMVNRVKAWLEDGKDVRIFTARVATPKDGRDLEKTVRVIEEWSLAHIGRILPVTHVKDHGLVELWDDRAIQIIKNTGIRADGNDPESSNKVCPSRAGMAPRDIPV